MRKIIIIFVSLMLFTSICLTVSGQKITNKVWERVGVKLKLFGELTNWQYEVYTVNQKPPTKRKNLLIELYVSDSILNDTNALTQLTDNYQRFITFFCFNYEPHLIDTIRYEYYNLDSVFHLSYKFIMFGAFGDPLTIEQRISLLQSILTNWVLIFVAGNDIEVGMWDNYKYKKPGFTERQYTKILYRVIISFIIQKGKYRKMEFHSKDLQGRVKEVWAYFLKGVKMGRLY